MIKNMTNLQAGIWLISILGGTYTILFSLEEDSTVAMIFVSVGVVTILFLTQKIHELETEIAELKKP